MADKLDDLVGSVAENDILAGHAETLRDGATQFVAAAVGIEVGALQCAAHRFECLGGGAERVLIGGELDDLLLAQAEIAGQLLDGLAGLVNGQFQDMLMRGFPHIGQLKEVADGRKVGRWKKVSSREPSRRDAARQTTEGSPNGEPPLPRGSGVNRRSGTYGTGRIA